MLVRSIRSDLINALLGLTFVLAPASPIAAQAPTIEFIAHAAVVIESGATRVLIDPYNGSRWMGYGFPRDLDVDAVLVTHPHYDHDASYYAGPSVPVFTEPGRYRVGDVELVGVEAEHAGGDRFRQRGVTPFNVVWTVVAGESRLTHVGDNRVLTDADMVAIGSTDVLFIPPFHDVESATREAEELGAGTLVPIHYRLPEMAAVGYGMPTVEDWLGGAEATRHVGHRYEARLPRSSGLEIVVLEHHPDVLPWRPELQTAWQLAEEARELSGQGEAVAGMEGLAEAAEKLSEAIALAPEVMSFPLELGTVLRSLGQDGEAMEVWEAALARALEGDTEPTLRIRVALAAAYEGAGREAEAELLRAALATVTRSYAAEVLAIGR